MSEKKTIPLYADPERQKNYEMFCQGWNDGVDYVLREIEKHGLEKTIEKIKKEKEV